MTVAQLLAGPKNLLPLEGNTMTIPSLVGNEHSPFSQLLSQFQGELGEGMESMNSLGQERYSSPVGLIESLLELLPSEWKQSESTFELDRDMTDEAELHAFLEQIDHQFSTLPEDNSEEALEALYSLFQQIPITLVQGQRVTQTAQSQEPRYEQLLVKNDEALVIVKWSKLLDMFNQTIKRIDDSQGSPQDSSQVRQVISNLKNLFSQEVSFRQFLLNRFTGDHPQLDVQTQGSKVAREPVHFFQSFLPTSLLTKAHPGFSSPIDGSSQLDEGAQVQKDGSLGNRLTEQVATNQESKIGQLIKAIATEEAVPTARLSHFVQDMKEVMKNHFQQLNSQDVSQIRIKLSPEHLGHLDIRIISIEGKISALVTASNSLAREALEHQVNQLRVALTQQGLQVDRIEVTQQNSSNNTLFNQEQRSGQQFTNEKNGKSTFAEELAEEDEQNVDFDNELQDSSNINYVV